MKFWKWERLYLWTLALKDTKMLYDYFCSVLKITEKPDFFEQFETLCTILALNHHQTMSQKRWSARNEEMRKSVKKFPPPLINLDEFLASKRGEMCNHLIHSTKEAASESRFNLVLWNRRWRERALQKSFSPIIGLSIEEFFVLPHSLLRLNCPRASLTTSGCCK